MLQQPFTIAYAWCEALHYLGDSDEVSPVTLLDLQSPSEIASCLCATHLLHWYLLTRRSWAYVWADMIYLSVLHDVGSHVWESGSLPLPLWGQSVCRFAVISDLAVSREFMVTRLPFAAKL